MFLLERKNLIILFIFIYFYLFLFIFIYFINIINNLYHYVFIRA